MTLWCLMFHAKLSKLYPVRCDEWFNTKEAELLRAGQQKSLFQNLVKGPVPTPLSCEVFGIFTFPFKKRDYVWVGECMALVLVIGLLNSATITISA